MHIAVLGKTGSGKSSLLRYLCLQDIAAGTRVSLLRPARRGHEVSAARHRGAREGTEGTPQRPADRDLARRPGSSVGLNPLEQAEPDFVQIAEFAEMLKMRWGLDHFGARTDELLRNSLYVLSANGLTLLELAPLLTDAGFRAQCLKKTPNAEVRQYFEFRYGQASEPMRATMREPILNKTSAFTADPRFRHIVGQAKSTFSIREAMDQGYWIIADLPKGRLGAQALTLASLLLTVAKNAIFTRESRSLFTLYCDEIQNLIGAVERHRDGAVGGPQVRRLGRLRQPVPRPVPGGDARGDPLGRHPRLLPAVERGCRHGRADARRRQVARREAEEPAAAAVRGEVRSGALARGMRANGR